MPTRLQIARKDIIKAFQESGNRIYTQSNLASMLSTNRTLWRLAQATSAEQFASFLVERTKLRKIELKSNGQYDRLIRRYIWDKVSPYEVALSVREGSYLSHGTALYLHGLTEQVPATIFANREQTPKPQGILTGQAGIDRAFSNKPRQSNYGFRYLNWKILILSGKYTNRLEVGTITDPEGGLVQATNIERTLIDIAVRPFYAGGVFEVLKAFKAAKNRMSVNVLIATLKKLDYAYPYHQAIGFYMSRAGYEENRTHRLRKLGLHWNFYLTHDMREREFDSSWRIFYPKGF